MIKNIPFPKPRNCPNRLELLYTLLADADKSVAREYGALNLIGMANCLTFLIGKDGRIAYVDYDVNKHLATCAPDWLNWAKTHRAMLEGK